MKKFNLDPLALDKETIAMLDEKQLQEIMGGGDEFLVCPAGSSCLGTTTSAVSTGCGTGSSVC